MTKYSSTGKTSTTLLKSLKEYYGGPAAGPDGKYDVHQKTFYINLLDLRNIYIILQKFFWPLEGDISRKKCRRDLRLTPKLAGFS